MLTMKAEILRSQGEKLTPLQRTWKLFILEKEDILVVIIYSIALGILSLAVPITIQSLVNTVAFASLIQPLFTLMSILLAALIAAAYLRALQYRVTEMLQRRIFIRITNEIVSCLPKLKYEVFEQNNPIKLLNYFFDIFTTQKSISSLLLGGLDAILVALVGMFVLAFYHPFLLALDIILILCSVFVFIIMSRGGSETSIKESKAKYEVAGWLEEIVTHPIFFKSSQGHDFAQQKISDLSSTYLEKRNKHFKVIYRQLLAVLGLEILASITLLSLGGFLVINKQLTLGQLIAAELIVTAVVASIAKLGSKVETFYDLVAAVDKLGKLLDLPIETERELSSSINQLEITKTTEPLLQVKEITYHDILGQQMAINFECFEGEHILLNHFSEFQRLSICNILFGLKTPLSGSVQLGHYHLVDQNLHIWRSHIKLLREPELFELSIYENLRTSNSELTLHDAWSILERVGLKKSIVGLKDGIHTVLINSKTPLSKSQCFLLAIARILLTNPSVILMDSVYEQLTKNDKEHFKKLLQHPKTPVTIQFSHKEILSQFCTHTFSPKVLELKV